MLLVFAHPDDESMSSGGAIALFAKKGAHITLICATKGEAGQRGEPPLCTKEELPKVREKELRAAARILGITKIHFLGFIDGTLKNIPVRELRKHIASYMNSENPDVVLTFNKEGGSRHPDHMQISKATTKAFFAYAETVKKHVRLYHTALSRTLIKKLEKDKVMYNAFGKIKGTSKDHITTIVNINPVLATKIKAIKAHKTQHKDWELFMKRLVHEEAGFESFQLIAERNL